ncbi:ferroxidase HEPHL1-like [Centroberyx gerrardi]|uniref:ferroxidase HEPHL1-like n=1 Tax=Centroberyx gerrardi TaxID=166262 RepID=UPI003AADEB59
MASRPYSIHPHGLNYSKDNEGALYPDGTGPEQKRDDSVGPGRTVTYEWTLPASHSPAAEDGTLDVHGDRSGDSLYALLFMVSDENFSWCLDDNIKTFTTAPNTVNKEDEGFMESNKMHAINGFVYRNLPGLTMCKGDKVTWHLSGLGSEMVIHSLYFHGNCFRYRQNRQNSIIVFPHISHTVTIELGSMGMKDSASVNLLNIRSLQ